VREVTAGAAELEEDASRSPRDTDFACSGSGAAWSALELVVDRIWAGGIAATSERAEAPLGLGVTQELNLQLCLGGAVFARSGA
jgi:hypothetical protein